MEFVNSVVVSPDPLVSPQPRWECAPVVCTQPDQCRWQL